MLFLFASVATLAIASMVAGLEAGLEPTDLTPDSSYLREFMNAEQKHWGTETTGRALPVALVFRNIPPSYALAEHCDPVMAKADSQASSDHDACHLHSLPNVPD